MKGIVKAASILLIIGVLLVGVGYAAGGHFQRDGFLRSEDIHATYQDVTSIDFELGLGDYEIVEGDTFSITGTVPRGTTSANRNGEWEIRIAEHRGFSALNFGGIGRRDASPRAVITLPRGFEATELDVSIGMGSLSADTLAARDATLDVAMGEMTVAALTADISTLEIGMGELRIDTLDSKRADVEVGMGSGVIGLAAPWADYGYSADVGMGQISLNGAALTHGFADRETFGRTGDRMLSADVGMGELELYAEE